MLLRLRQRMKRPGVPSTLAFRWTRDREPLVRGDQRRNDCFSRLRPTGTSVVLRGMRDAGAPGDKVMKRTANMGRMH